MIYNLKGYRLFNSAEIETLQVRVFTEKGSFKASIPGGTSRGKHEAADLPVKKALKKLSELRLKVIGFQEDKWQELDQLLLDLDGTPNFSRIGGNTALALSLAVARASTMNRLWRLNQKGLEARFPLPVSNIIGGGKHGGNTLWQEFLVIPPKAKSPGEALETVIGIWKRVGESLKRKGLLLGNNREWAWTARLTDEKSLELLSRAAKSWDARLGVDFAASSFYTKKGYMYGKRLLKPEKHMEKVLDTTRRFKLLYLEDPFQEDDFDSFSALTGKIGKKSLVVGDDLYCTNPGRYLAGLQGRCTNGVIIKPNQVGTLSLARQVADMAQKAGSLIVPSHRSTETGDAWLSDLAVTFDAPLIKIGLGDMPKFNRLLELWEDIPHVSMAKLPGKLLK